jgi:hypothetical protein
MKLMMSLLVSHYLLEGVIVDGADELDPIRVILEVIFEVLYCPHNHGTEALSIFLWWCQEGTPYEFRWVDVFELSLTDTITFDRFYECFRWVLLPIVQVRSSIRCIEVKGCAHVGSVNNFQSVPSKLFIGHGMADGFGEADHLAG